jgi:hypothetical protein
MCLRLKSAVRLRSIPIARHAARDPTMTVTKPPCARATAEPDARATAEPDAWTVAESDA